MDDTAKLQEETMTDSSGGNNNRDNNNHNNIDNGQHGIIFPPTTRGIENSVLRHERPLFSERPVGNTAGPSGGGGGELMGPILRRKKVVSMPLAAGGDFFVSDDVGGPHRQLHQRERQLSQGAAGGTVREKQPSHEGNSSRQRQVTPTRHRTKQSSFMDNLVRRKQISLDLLGPNDFFAAPTEEEENIPLAPLTESAGENAAVPEDTEPAEKDQEHALRKEEDKTLFLPLRFSKPILRGVGGSGHGPTPEGAHGPSMFVTKARVATFDEEASEALRRQSRHSEILRLQLSALQNKIDEEEDDEKRSILMSVSGQIVETQTAIEKDQNVLFAKMTTQQEMTEVKKDSSDETSGDVKPAPSKFEDGGIVRADKSDKIKAAIVFFIMLTFTVVVCTWNTHTNAESHIYSPVGLACVTDCPGNLETRDFFAHGHNHFEQNELIQLIIHIDANEDAADHTYTMVELVGEETGRVKAVRQLGPVHHQHRTTFDAHIKVDFDHPEEHHIINVNSTDPAHQLGFTLVAEVRTPLANYSVIVAAVIMVIVYAFILIEVIHRTLIAIFGSVRRLSSGQQNDCCRRVHSPCPSNCC
jgi:hypothetical protein